MLALALLMTGGARRATAAELVQPDVTQVSGPVVTAVVGRVEVRAQRGTSWEPVAVGALLRPGDTVRTASRAKAEVTHPAGMIRLFEHTILRVPVEVRGTVHLVRRPELLVGRALFDVLPDRLGGFISTVGAGLQSLFEVATPHVISGVKGTRFAVIEQGSQSVVVTYSGIVVTMNESGSPRDTALLTMGKMATYESGRLTAVSSVRVQDDWAAWTRPAVHKPRAPEGATTGGSSSPTRESRLDGGTTEAVLALLAESATSEMTVISTPTTDIGGGVLGTTLGGGLTDTSSTPASTTPTSTTPTSTTPTSTTPTSTTPTSTAPASDGLPSMTPLSTTLSAPLSVSPSGNP